MREILFRGKTTEDRWVEGTYFKHDTVKVCFSSDDPKPRHLIIQDGFCDWGFEPPIHCVDVVPDTVSQFTGLTDKNGKKIFEGDVVRVLGNQQVRDWRNVDYIGLIAFLDAGFCVLDGTIEDHGFRRYGLSRLDFDLEVIGNIHDNPELLEVSGDG